MISAHPSVCTRAFFGVEPSMKRFLTAAGLTAALALTGCASAPDPDYVPPSEEERAQEASDGFVVIRKNLGDGRIVICVTNELAISCDWGNTE